MSVKIREARLEDFDGVMDINKDVYEGLDYLPYKYHMYIKEGQSKGNRICLVAETNEGKIVAFRMAFLVDEGHTLIAQAVRVHPKYTSKGINKLLQDAVVERCKTKVTKFISTTWQTEIWEKRERNGTSPMTIAARSPRVSFETNPVSLSIALEKAYRHSEDLNKLFEKTLVLSRDDARELLSSAELRDFIRTSDFVYSWDVFNLKFVSNVEWIMQCRNVILRTLNKDGALNGVSLANALPCKLGIRLFADVYCAEADVTIAHIIKHIQMLQQFCKSTPIVGTFFLHQCSAKHKTEAKKFVAEYMGLYPKQNLNENDFIILERIKNLSKL
ncbi:unnamed protein product [Owenia fusiformis]|uniref:N-acetyltransferase domain-containing protein n=1 Tax=Owenia fusiformis TaxID=6347 RepID=A0A8S4Q2T7_OWEFU|nr:unnamed protein product [Owenia fusiformis]